MQQLRLLRREVTDTSRDVAGLGRSLAAMTGLGGLGALGGLATGIVAVGTAAVVAGNKTATFYANISKGRTALAGVSSSAADYQAGLKGIDDAVASLATPLGETTAQFVQLRAATAAAGLDADATTKIYKNLAAANLALGGDSQKLQGIMTATVQVFSKGKVSAEELRGQIGERLAGAMTDFARSSNKGAAALEDALRKGQVSLADFVAFADYEGKKYGKTADEMAKSSMMAGARMQNAWEKLAEAMGPITQGIGAAVQDMATGILNSLTPVIERINEILGLTRQAQNDKLYNTRAEIARIEGERIIAQSGGSAAWGSNPFLPGASGKAGKPAWSSNPFLQPTVGNPFAVSLTPDAYDERLAPLYAERARLEKLLKPIKFDTAKPLPADIGGGGKGKGSSQAGPSQAEINAKALLATIRYAEGTPGPRGYGTHFGGSYTPPGGPHPDRVIRAGQYASAAYGAYQFMPDTWRGVGGGSMTPARQDAGALQLIRRRGVDPGQPLTRGMIDKLAPEWASFPTLRTGTSYYGQGGKTFKQLEEYYRAQVAKGGGDIGDVDLALGRESVNAEEDRLKAAERAAEEAAKAAEIAAKDLIVRKDRLALSGAELGILQAITPLDKIEAEYKRDVLQVQQDIAGLVQDDVTAQLEKNLLLDAQANKVAKIQALAVDAVRQQESALRPLLDDIERLETIFKGPDAVKALERRNAVGALMGAGVDPAKAGALYDQREGLQKVLDKQKEVDAAYRSIGDTIRSSMGSAINDLIRGTATWEEALVGVLDNLANVLLQFGMNGIFDGLGGGGGFLGQLFGRRALGGPVSSGTPYIVGERGPELFVPGTSGSIMTNKDTMGLGGGGNAVVNVTVHNNGSSTVTGDDASRLGNMVQAAVAATIQREQRPGGSLNRRR